MFCQYRDLKGNTAVVTGASQGIGYAITEAFCANGTNVALIDVKADALEAAVSKLRGAFPDVHVEPCVCNIADETAVDVAFQKINDAFGSIRYLVNNAGVMRRSMIAETKDADWNFVLSVNVNGTLHCCRAVYPFMAKNNGGAIVNVSTNVAKLPSVSMASYCVSKSAIETLTKVMAAEYAPDNIRVNGYAPGVVETDMTKDILSQRAEEKLRTIPINRFTQPGEIANLVMFLCSDASSSIVGTIVAIDGGITATHNPWNARRQ